MIKFQLYMGEVATVVTAGNGQPARTDAERWEGVRELIKGIDSRKQEAGEAYIVGLWDRIATFERRHEMASEKMMESLLGGDLKETSDIALWAWTWQTLKQIEEGIPMTGIP